MPLASSEEVGKGSELISIGGGDSVDVIIV